MDIYELAFILIETQVFQMKSRKQKLSHPKRTVLMVEELQPTELNNLSGKVTSSHTKISTNSIHPAPDKRARSRRNVKNASKQNPVDTQSAHSHSKLGRKTKKYDLPLNRLSHSLDNGDQTCREYCVVDQNFIPITDNSHQKLMEDMLAKTASTSCDKTYFTSIVKPAKARLRKHSIISDNLDQSLPVKGPTRHDKAISNMQTVVEYRAAEVEAVAESCEIGMQYSQRKEFVEESKKEEGGEKANQEKLLKVQEDRQKIISSSGNQKQTISQESLSDLFFKLEFTHLGDEQSFNHLSSNQTEHFSQLLETLITKMKPRKTMLRPILFQASNSQESHASPRTAPSKDQLSEMNYEKMQSLLLMRESQQMNCSEDLTDYSSEGKVNTSLIYMLNFLGHLFCHIEVHYAEEFVYMIRKMYGLSFREKYRRITRDQPLTFDTKFKVIDGSLFEDLVNQSDGSYYNANEIMHFRAVFDAFNEHLEEYRPYYLGNGEQFPWAFKMFLTMSEYSIDEDSLQIIFRQAKDKMVEWATLLCGIHIDFNQPMPENNPLEFKKMEKENRMICSWVGQENFEKDGVELYSTQVLHKAAEGIYEQLLEEFLAEAGFCFN